MDVQMPILDGYDATREIRRRESLSGDHVVVIGVTAHAMPEHIQACLTAGMDAVITKPIDPGTFAQTVKEHLAGQVGQE
jgi:CheY-like chemotaxis protein